MKRPFFFTCFILVMATLAGPTFAQGNCNVGDVEFDCPEYFNEVKTTDSKIRIFKYKEKDSGLYFFISVLPDPFSPDAVTSVLRSGGSMLKDQQFSWKRVTKPLVMQMKTKHKYDLTASLGLSSRLLVEVKAFGFEINGSKFVLGYLSDWSQDAAANRLAFDSGRAKGDYAPGCNAVVSVLNSVTREFPESKQYCFFTGFSAGK